MEQTTACFNGSKFVMLLSEPLSCGYGDSIGLVYYERETDEEFVPQGVFLKLDQKPLTTRAFCIEAPVEVVDIPDCRIVVREIAEVAMQMVQGLFFLQFEEVREGIRERIAFLEKHPDFSTGRGSAREQVLALEAILHAGNVIRN